MSACSRKVGVSECIQVPVDQDTSAKGVDRCRTQSTSPCSAHQCRPSSFNSRLSNRIIITRISSRLSHSNQIPSVQWQQTSASTLRLHTAWTSDNTQCPRQQPLRRRSMPAPVSTPRVRRRDRCQLRVTTLRTLFRTCLQWLILRAWCRLPSRRSLL